MAHALGKPVLEAKLRFLFLTAAAAAACTIAAPFAGAQSSKEQHRWSSMSLAQIIKVQRASIQEDWKIITTRRAGWRTLAYVHSATPPVSLRLPSPYSVRWHWAHLRWTKRELKENLHKLSRPRVGHLAFWTCVHNGEGAWNADTGNGFHGGLQMTYGWNGLVGNAALLSPAQQIAAAEEGFRRSGYSTSWLRGQWPMTSPPCMGLL